jgi:hypothetical protein
MSRTLLYGRNLKSRLSAGLKLHNIIKLNLISVKVMRIGELMSIPKLMLQTSG